MVSHAYHFNCGTQHLVHVDSCGIVGTVVTLLHSEIFNLSITEFASGTANPQRLANVQASARLFPSRCRAEKSRQVSLQIEPAGLAHPNLNFGAKVCVGCSCR